MLFIIQSMAVQNSIGASKQLSYLCGGGELYGQLAAISHPEGCARMKLPQQVKDLLGYYYAL